MRGVLAKISPIVAGQLTLAMVAMLMMAFTPPAQGRMLLLPINGEAISEATIQDHRATPLRPGPVYGSWVVDGERSALAGLLASKGILVLAAPAALCASGGDPS